MNPPASSPSVIWWTGIAAAFCLLVGGVMWYQHGRASERDPWKSPQLLALKEELRVAPKDENLKVEIRRLDLEFRERFFRRLALNRMGGWLLVGGLLTLVVAGRIWWKSVAPLWRPKLRVAASDSWQRPQQHARWALGGIGIIVALGVLTLIFTAPAPVPASVAEMEKLLGRTEATGELDPSPTAAELAWNWPQFRGFEGRGVGASPVHLAGGSPPVLWRTPIAASGFNSPVVWSNRLFFSAGDAEKREVFCFDTTDGKLLWQRGVDQVPGSPTTPLDIPEMTGFAAITMATDGQRAYVMFANSDIAAFDFAGNRVWAKNLGVPKNMYGQASSLALAPGRLVIQFDQDEGAPGGSSLVVLDAATGRELWERTKPTHGSWASPIIADVAGQAKIITLALPYAMSHALADGRELWRAEVMSGEIAPSPIYAGEWVIAISPAHGLIGIQPDGTGDVTKTHVKWTAEENIPDITSPVSDGELVFTITTMGELACFDLTEKKTIWQKPLEFEVQASPVIAGGQLLILGTHGELVVAAVAREFRELGRFTLEDEFHASPALVNGRMFLRGKNHLWCLGNN
jgi:outer membrane protein assembly factor BamB